jgi:hypothetical protein
MTGLAAPRNKPLGATSNPDHRVTDATKNYARAPLHSCNFGIPVNDPG